MPFICLANPNIPDGVLQITDLWPNTSQRNQVLDPPGQSRYLRRPGTHVPGVNPTSGNVVGSPAETHRLRFEGLAAYLVDRVEPGAASVANAAVTITNVAAGARIVIKTIVFEFFNNGGGGNDLAGRAGSPAVPFLVERESGIGVYAGDNDVATNLAAALNDNGDVAPAMDAVATLNLHTEAAAVNNVVTIQPEDGVPAFIPGPTGQFAVTTTDANQLALDADSALKGRMTRAFELWSPANIALAVTAVQDLVDNGNAATLTAINNAIQGAVSGDLDGGLTASSLSTGTLADILSILAGRRYEVAAGAVKFTAVTAPDTVSTWLAAQRGAFTTPVTVFGQQMYGGEWGPSGAVRPDGSTLVDDDGVAIPDYWSKHGHNKAPTVDGGDIQNNEIGEARATFDGTHLQASVQNGQLAQYAAGITLFPDADVQAKVAPTLASKQTRQASLVNQRIVTVYDDDGTLLV